MRHTRSPRGLPFKDRSPLETGRGVPGGPYEPVLSPRRAPRWYGLFPNHSHLAAGRSIRPFPQAADRIPRRTGMDLSRREDARAVRCRVLSLLSGFPSYSLASRRGRLRPRLLRRGRWNLSRPSKGPICTSRRKIVRTWRSFIGSWRAWESRSAGFTIRVAASTQTAGASISGANRFAGSRKSWGRGIPERPNCSG